VGNAVVVFEEARHARRQQVAPRNSNDA
jgi:hypothetical protein